MFTVLISRAEKGSPGRVDSSLLHRETPFRGAENLAGHAAMGQLEAAFASAVAAVQVVHRLGIVVEGQRGIEMLQNAPVGDSRGQDVQEIHADVVLEELELEVAQEKDELGLGQALGLRKLPRREELTKAGESGIPDRDISETPITSGKWQGGLVIRMALEHIPQCAPGLCFRRMETMQSQFYQGHNRPIQIYNMGLAHKNQSCSSKLAHL